jgi:hypothetical protein
MVLFGAFVGWSLLAGGEESRKTKTD